MGKFYEHSIKGAILRKSSVTLLLGFAMIYAATIATFYFVYLDFLK